MMITNLYTCLALLVIVIVRPVMADPPSVDWNLNEWVSWREGKIHQIFEKSFPSGSPSVLTRQLVIDRCTSTWLEVNSSIPELDLYLAKRADVNKAMANFLSFVSAQAIMSRPNHQLGFKITDEEYLEYAATHLEFPEFLKSNEFLRLMAQPSTYQEGLSLLKKHIATLPMEERWVVFPFEAQFIKSIPDDGHGRTYGRMVVFVPGVLQTSGAVLDRWFLFSIAMPDQPTAGDIRPVSLISFLKIPKIENAKGPTSKVYFMDFIRVKKDDEVSLKPAIIGNHSKNCYDCHKSAVISIQPKFELDFINGQALRKQSINREIVDELNEIIFSYKKFGIPDWGPINLAAYGPSMGNDAVDRSDEFIARATSDLTLDSSSIAKIKSAMKCAECHSKFAPLNYLQALPHERDISGTFQRRESMIKTHILEGWMPPDENLTVAEREGLYRSLIEEYANLDKLEGSFFSWLRGKR